MRSCLLPMEITAPTIEYGLLAPVLIIFAGACLGVLAEAVVPRELRRAVQLVVTFASLGLGLATTLLNWASGAEAVVAVDSLALDGPTYFMWTIVIIFSAASLLMFAETKIENASVFAPQAAAVPGTPAEREAIRVRVSTPRFPARALRGVGDDAFPGVNDLITMFVSLEILSLPLYLLCGLARRRRLLSQGLHSSTSCWERCRQPSSSTEPPCFMAIPARSPCPRSTMRSVMAHRVRACSLPEWL